MKKALLTLSCIGLALFASAQKNNLQIDTVTTQDPWSETYNIRITYDESCEDIDGDNISDGWQGNSRTLITSSFWDTPQIKKGQSFSFIFSGTAKYTGSFGAYLAWQTEKEQWTAMSETKKIDVKEGEHFDFANYLTIETAPSDTSLPYLVLIAFKDNNSSSASSNFNKDDIELTLTTMNLRFFDTNETIYIPIPNLTITLGDKIEPIDLKEHFISNEPLTFELFSEPMQEEGEGMAADFVLIDGHILSVIQYGPGFGMARFWAEGYESGSADGSFEITIKEPEGYEAPECELEVEETITDLSCFGTRDGSIELKVSGGVEPYTYKWNTNRTSNGIYNMPAGMYSVIITDSVGCTTSKRFWLGEPYFDISSTITSTACGENNGVIALDDWYSDVTYTWDDGETGTYRTNLAAGAYIVTATKDGCSKKDTIFVKNDYAPSISLAEVKEADCQKAEGAILVNVTGGTQPLTYTWNGEKQEDADLENAKPGLYTLEVTDAIGCKSYFQAEIPSKSFNMQPEIASITIGEESHDVLVVWQKEKTEYIDFYTIYREQNDNPGKFDTLGTVPYSNISVYADEIVNPMQDSWRYKISATDFCGNESPMGYGENKSIHLDFNLTEDKIINLFWDAYEGKNFDHYTIYKITAKGKIKVADVPANVTRYSEKLEYGVRGYCIGVNFTNPIDVTTYLKAESGPFALAISNIAEIENNSIETAEQLSARVWTQQGTIVIENNALQTISVYDIIGNKIATDNSKSLNVTIPISKQGVYIVVVGNEAFKIIMN